MDAQDMKKVEHKLALIKNLAEKLRGEIPYRYVDFITLNKMTVGKQDLHPFRDKSRTALEQANGFVIILRD